MIALHDVLCSTLILLTMLTLTSFDNAPFCDLLDGRVLTDVCARVR